VGTSFHSTAPAADPVITGSAQRVVPRVDKASPPASPRARKGGVGHVRFEATDVMRPSSAISHVSSIHSADPDDHESANRRLAYSPAAELMDPKHSAVDFGRVKASTGVPPLATGALAAQRLHGAGPRAGAIKMEAGREAAASVGSEMSRARSAPAPNVVGGSMSTAVGSSARGIQSARAGEVERNSTMMRHINAAYSDKRIDDKTWSKALIDVDAKTKTVLALLDRVVYVKKEHDNLVSGFQYERPTVSATLKVQSANAGAVSDKRVAPTGG
jgi:hypothetical protein